MDDRCRGERFRDARNGTPMSIVEENTGVTTSTITDLENDDKDRGVRYQQVVKLADYYRVSIDWLLCRSDAVSINPTVESACKFTELSQEALLRVKNLDRLDRQFLDVFLRSRDLSEIIKIMMEYAKFNFYAQSLPSGDSYAFSPTGYPGYEGDHVSLTPDTVGNAFKISLAEKLTPAISEAYKEYIEFGRQEAAVLFNYWKQQISAEEVSGSGEHNKEDR